MKSDQPPPGNSDQVNSDIDQGGSQLARSYDCTYCKRGFSNAQALGGHMNIHRREKKAVHKQVVLNKTQPSLDKSRETLPKNSSWPLETKTSSSDKSNTVQWPWMPSQQGDDQTPHVGEEVQQLPLFVETSSEKDNKPGSQLHRNIDKDLSSTTTHALSGSGIDLELRLGPEPQDQSAPTETQKFF